MGSLTNDQGIIMMKCIVIDNEIIWHVVKNMVKIQQADVYRMFKFVICVIKKPLCYLCSASSILERGNSCQQFPACVLQGILFGVITLCIYKINLKPDLTLIVFNSNFCFRERDWLPVCNPWCQWCFFKQFTLSK